MWDTRKCLCAGGDDSDGETSDAGEREIIIIITSLRRQEMESQAYMEGLSALERSQRHSSPIATGQRQRPGMQVQEAQRLADDRWCSYLIACFLGELWGSVMSWERIRRSGVGGLRENESSHFGEWESVDLHSRISTRNILRSEVIKVQWDHSGQCLLPPEFSYLCTEMNGIALMETLRVNKTVSLNNLENWDLILHWSEGHAQNWPFSILKYSLNLVFFFFNWNCIVGMFSWVEVCSFWVLISNSVKLYY